MTNKEIDKILSMLNKKSIEEIKKILNNEKEKNIKNFRQKTFESYICKDGVAFKKFGDNHGSILHETDKKIIFSNGYSIYYINKNLLNLKTPKLIRCIKGKGVRHQHTISIVNIEKIKELEDFLKKLITEFKQLEFLPDYLNKNTVRFSVFNPYHDLTENINEFSEFEFSSKEVDTAEILLDNPKFMMDISNPVLYGESDIGKCYILGLKKN